MTGIYHLVICHVTAHTVVLSELVNHRLKSIGRSLESCDKWPVPRVNAQGAQPVIRTRTPLPSSNYSKPSAHSNSLCTSVLFQRTALVSEGRNCTSKS